MKEHQMISEDLAQIDEKLARHDLLPSIKLRLIVKRRILLADAKTEPRQKKRTIALDEPRNLLASWIMFGGCAHGAERYFGDSELLAIAEQLRSEELETIYAELTDKPAA